MDRENVFLSRKSYFSCGVKREGFDAGFNYVFEVIFYGSIDPVTGLVVNLTDIKALLAEVETLVNQKSLNNEVDGLESYDLAGIHRFIHQKFSQTFKNAGLPGSIEFVGSKLIEGEGAQSDIFEDPSFFSKAHSLE